MHVLCLSACACVPLRLPKRSGSFSVAHAVWALPYLPPCLLPRASFPVLLSLPAAASLDFVSDFPRKGLCAGHGVKNTTFLMHSLGKRSKRPLPLSVLAPFFTASLLAWHFLSLSICLLHKSFTCLRSFQLHPFSCSLFLQSLCFSLIHPFYLTYMLIIYLSLPSFPVHFSRLCFSFYNST